MVGRWVPRNTANRQCRFGVSPQCEVASDLEFAILRKAYDIGGTTARKFDLEHYVSNNKPPVDEEGGHVSEGNPGDDGDDGNVGEAVADDAAGGGGEGAHHDEEPHAKDDPAVASDGDNGEFAANTTPCLLYTSPSPRDRG